MESCWFDSDKKFSFKYSSKDFTMKNGKDFAQIVSMFLGITGINGLRYIWLKGVVLYGDLQSFQSLSLLDELYSRLSDQVCTLDVKGSISIQYTWMWLAIDILVATFYVLILCIFGIMEKVPLVERLT